MASSHAATSATLPTAQLMTLQSGHASMASPVFCVPGAGATVTCFLPLVDALGPQVPVHAFQPRGLDGQDTPNTDIVVTAASYVAALLAQPRHGPCRLVGHSFGGWIVLEMARQLRAAGHEVAPVVILDGDPPSGEGVKRRPYSRVEALMELLHNLQLDSGQSCDIEADDLLALDDTAQLQRLLDWMVRAGLMHARTQLQAVRGLVDVFCANINTRYAPTQPVDVDLVLVRTADERREALSTDEAARRWRTHGRSLKLLAAGGNHMSMLEHPHIGVSLRQWW